MAVIEHLGKGVQTPSDTIFSVRGNGRKWAAALAARTVADPADLVIVGDSVTELMYGDYVYRLRERFAHMNGGVVSPGWINGAPPSNAIAGGVNILHYYAFALTTGTYSSGSNNTTDERGLGMYAFRLESGSVLTLKADVNQDGDWSDAITATPEFAYAHFHFSVYGTDAFVGSAEVRVDGVLVTTFDTFSADPGLGKFESGHSYTWSGTQGPHTITITGAGGAPIWFDGVYLQSEDETVRVWNAGNAGENYGDLLALPSATDVPPTFQAIEQIDADCVMLVHGINDYDAGSGLPALETNIPLAISGLRTASHDVTLGVAIPYPTQSRTDWPKFADGMRRQAAKADVPVLDLSWMLETGATSTDPHGLVGSDDVHQSEYGGEFYADRFADFLLGYSVNWVDVLGLTGGVTLAEVQSSLLTGDISATFTGSSFAAGLVVTKLDSGKAYILLYDDKGSATTGLFGEMSAVGRGATGMLGATGINGLAGFRFRAASTWTDSSAPTDIEVFNAASGSTTVGVRATFLAGGGIKFPEMTPPAGVSNNVILCGRDDGELVMVRPDSSIEPIASRAPRVVSTASSGTPTPNADITDLYIITAQAATWVIGAPTGTPAQGQKLLIRMKDNGTARTGTWNAIYRAIGVTLPLTTVISKYLYIGMVYNSTDTRWDVLAVGQEA